MHDQITLVGGEPGSPGATVTVAAFSAAFRARYELEQKIGEGAVGQVFRALDRKTDRKVAIKFLAGTRTDDEKQRFLREGRLLAGLSSPSLVKVFEMDLMDEVPYLVTELLEGGTLRDELDRGVAVPIRRSVETICAILDALEECHENGIIHRDLKPENVLFSADRRPKVADLGVARDLEATGGLTKTGALVGTPRYMSPEQVTGDLAGPQSDLYSAALMLHEMLTGTHPQPTASLAEIMVWHLNGVPPDLRALVKGLPPRIAELVQQGLAKKAADRPASAAAFAADLRQALAARANSGRLAGPDSKPRTGSFGSSGAGSSGGSGTSGFWSSASETLVNVGFVLGVLCFVGLVVLNRMDLGAVSNHPIPKIRISPSPAATASPARAAALARLEAIVTDFAPALESGLADFNVVNSWMKTGVATVRASTNARSPAAIAKLENAVKALSDELPEPSRVTRTEARALARARGFLLAQWCMKILDGFLTRADAQRPAFVVFQQVGSENLLAGADAEYPAEGAELMRRWLVQVAAVIGRAVDSGESAAEEVVLLADLLMVGRGFGRVRWTKASDREYTYAINRFRSSMTALEGRPLGLLAAAADTSLMQGLEGATGRIAAKRLGETVATLESLRRELPGPNARLDELLQRIRERYANVAGASASPDQAKGGPSPR